jgi:hypothetical protein
VLPEGRRPKDVDARVDLGDGGFGIRRVLLLHDALDGAVGAADDAAVAGRVGEHGRQQRHGGAGGAVIAHQGGERVGIQQRHVAGEDEDVAGELGHGGEGDLDGAAGAGDLVLVDDDHLVRDARDRLGDLVALVAHDDEDVPRREVARGVEHVPDERAAADAVQHLRQGRAHAGPLTRREDDDGERGVQRVLCHAPPPGFEPGPHSSKGCRAAVTPRRTARPRDGEHARTSLPRRGSAGWRGESRIPRTR